MYIIHVFVYLVIFCVLVIRSLYRVSALSSILSFSATVNSPFWLLTLSSHLSRYGRNVSSSHYMKRNSNNGLFSVHFSVILYVHVPYIPSV